MEAIAGISVWDKVCPTSSEMVPSLRKVRFESCTIRVGVKSAFLSLIGTSGMRSSNDKRSSRGEASKILSRSSTDISTRSSQSGKAKCNSVSPVKRFDDQGSVALRRSSARNGRLVGSCKATESAKESPLDSSYVGEK